MTNPAESMILARDVVHRYGETVALDGLSFSVERSEIYGVLGPNGGGKTTLFRILSTALPLQGGSITIDGANLPAEVAQIRERLAVVFQSPSLDEKLTVAENLRHHGHLYGLRGNDLSQRIDSRLDRLALTDRRDAIVETLSGGLRRRVELAKGLLTSPTLLIMDEPSTGLDPGARRDLWQYLFSLRDTEGTTILVTTHLIEEAERCDRLAILESGRIVSSGSPRDLRRRIGGDIIAIRSAEPDALADLIRERFGEEVRKVDGTLRLEREDGQALVREIYQAFPEQIESISVGHPTLEDVFVRETGHTLWGS